MDLFRQAVQQKINYPELVFATETAQDIESGIHHYIETDYPEMLIMLERDRVSFWEKLWHRDLVKTMEFEIGIPLMVFNKKNFLLGSYEQVKDKAFGIA